MCLRAAPKTQIYFVENQFSSFPLIFIVFFLALLKTFRNFLLLTPQSTNLIHYSIRKDTFKEYPSIFTDLQGDDRHKKKTSL